MSAIRKIVSKGYYSIRANVPSTWDTSVHSFTAVNDAAARRVAERLVRDEIPFCMGDIRDNGYTLYYRRDVGYATEYDIKTEGMA